MSGERGLTCGPWQQCRAAQRLTVSLGGSLLVRGRAATSTDRLVPREFSLIQIKFKLHSNLTRSKQNLPKLEKFEIKYDCEGFDVSNIFPYLNFSRFEMEFELKIREAYRV
jgi:hypothetical protein